VTARAAQRAAAALPLDVPGAQPSMRNTTTLDLVFTRS